MKKKIMSLLIVAAMAAGLVACGSNAGTSSSSKGGDAATVDTSEHVVVTYMTTGGKPTNGATEEMLEKLNKILTEKVNAEIAMYYIDWTDYLSVYNLTLAQMDGTVDLVGTATDWLDAWPNAKNGAFLELSEDMLSTYCPQTYASVSKEHWDLCKYNDNIYLIPEDNYAQWTNHGFAYRLDWAKAAGLANGVKSWEDLTTYFKYVTDNKNNLGVSVAWDSDGTQYGQMAGGYITSKTNYISIDGINSGAMWGGTKDDPYTIYCPYMTETDLLVKYAKLMKDWDSMGVWKTDVLNNANSTNRDDFKVGLVAAEQHHTQTWTDLVSHKVGYTIYDDPNADTGFFYFGEESKNVVALNITHGAMAISAASKNPERALMVYDLIRNDPECYRLFNYGVEGRQYELTADGMRQQPASYNQENDSITTNYWWGRNDDLEVKDASMNWAPIEALYKEYDGIKIDYQYGQLVADVDAIQSNINNINEIYTNYMKLISFGKYTGTAEDIVAQFQAELKNAGVDTVTAELQKQIDAIYK